VLPGSFGSLTLLAVLDPCNHVGVATVETRQIIRNSVQRRDVLKGPKHDQVEGEFFYIKQTRMVR
jgi:hypothetical protein